MSAETKTPRYELPWSLDEFQRDGAAWGYIVSKHDTIVCEIAGILDSCGNRENAEFILRAVNSLEAAERLVEEAEGALWNCAAAFATIKFNRDHWPELAKAKRDVDAALASIADWRKP